MSGGGSGAGLLHTCALDADRAVVCWGLNDEGQTDAPEGTYESVRAANVHSCALHTTGRIDCWGYSDRGATDVPPGVFEAIGTAGGASCGLRESGAIICWGRGSYSHGGAPRGRYIDVAVNSCALRADGTPLCWWRPHWPVERPEARSDVPDGTFAALSSGRSRRVCGLRTDTTVACWEDDSVPYASGSLEAPGDGYTAVAAGVPVGCGIRTDATLSCWRMRDAAPVEAPEGRFVAVDSGADHGWDDLCGVRADQSIACWIHTSADPFGDDFTPQQLDAPKGAYVAVAAGGDHNCALRTDQTVFCW